MTPGGFLALFSGCISAGVVLNKLRGWSGERFHRPLIKDGANFYTFYTTKNRIVVYLLSTAPYLPSYWSGLSNCSRQLALRYVFLFSYNFFNLHSTATVASIHTARPSIPSQTQLQFFIALISDTFVVVCSSSS